MAAEGAPSAIDAPQARGRWTCCRGAVIGLDGGASGVEYRSGQWAKPTLSSHLSDTADWTIARAAAAITSRRGGSDATRITLLGRRTCAFQQVERAVQHDHFTPRTAVAAARITARFYLIGNSARSAAASRCRSAHSCAMCATPSTEERRQACGGCCPQREHGGDRPPLPRITNARAAIATPMIRSATTSLGNIGIATAGAAVRVSRASPKIAWSLE